MAATEPRLLITALLPMFIIGLCLYFVYLLIRREMVSQPVLAMLAVIAWVPLFAAKTAFRRQSMGFLLFVISVYAIVSAGTSEDSRFAYLAVLCSSLTFLTHHLSGVILAVFVSIYTLSTYTLPDSDRLSGLTNPVYLALIVWIVGGTWYVISGFGIEYILDQILNLTSFARLNDVVEFLFAGSSTDQFPYAISRSPLTTFRNTMLLWLYQVPIAILITAGLITKNEPDQTLRASFIFGALVAMLSALGFLTGIFAAVRVQTFFVVIGAPIAIKCINDVQQSLGHKSKIIDSIDPDRVGSVVISLLLILGAAQIPLYQISSSSPDYSEGQQSQRFGPTSYAVGEFVDKYTTKTPVGDRNTDGIVSTSSGRNVISNPFPFITGNIPPNQAVIVNQQNHEIYVGKVTGTKDWERVAFNPPPIERTFSKSNHIYTTGSTEIYVST